MNKKMVLINATAAKTSGALTILKDCVMYIENNTLSNYEYHLFTVIDEFDTSKNLQIHKLPIQNWLSRVQWDNGGLQKWCRKHNLEPDMIISFQNTSTKYRNNNGLMIVQMVYYHQPIPLYKRDRLNYDLKIMLYYYFYPLFVNRNNTLTHYVVQLPYIKELFCKKYRNITPDRVTVIRPNKPSINVTSIVGKTFPEEKNVFRFLYPATPLKYKNHKVLISALVKINKRNPDLIKKVVIYFTMDKLPERQMNVIKFNNLEFCIEFMGQVSYTELISYYKSVDALLFPSMIESFGLPLIEAECFGLPIIVSDLPYAKEVLENYGNKYFIDPDNTDAWVDAIQNYKNYQKIVSSNESCENTWKYFFDLADNLITE
jgi:glycosyltransferase involved in cell wall biosynthesis